MDFAPYNLQLAYSSSTPRADRVYLTSNRELARAWAARLQLCDFATGVIVRHGTLYQVEPIGPLEEDHQFLGSGVSWCATQARIIAVEEDNVAMDVYDYTQAIGPHMRWDDQSPVYTNTGHALPSPELRTAGYTPTDFTSHLPWTPIEFIHAELLGTETRARPTPELHQSILLKAAEPRAVQSNRCARTKALAPSGLVFGEHRTDDIGAINDLCGHITNPLTANEDNRGAVIARHPKAGIIAAAIIEPATIAGQVSYFISAVAVLPGWRGRGIGSNLILAAQQLLPATPMFAAGRCPKKIAPFFAQLGFTILQPGEALPYPGGRVIAVGSRDCWFYRQGRL